MKNKRGSVPLIILIAIVYFMFGMLIFQLIKPDVTRVRTATELNCTGVPDTGGDMMNCIIVDGVIPLIILTVLSTGGAYITDRALK